MPRPSYLTVEVPAELRAEVDHLADHMDESTSWVVRRALEEFVSRRNGGHPRRTDIAAGGCQTELVDMFTRWTSTN